MTVILPQRNHKIEYGEEPSERFKAGQKRSTVAAVKYTNRQELLVREILADKIKVRYPVQQDHNM